MRLVDDAPGLHLGVGFVHLGPFEGYEANREPMREVMGRHRQAVEAIGAGAPAPLLEAARRCGDEALARGERGGYRNAQVTVLAPTGTIGFMMACDTTGVEPDIALVKYKLLAGGGMLKIVNQTVPLALRTLGYKVKARRVVAVSVTDRIGAGAEIGHLLGNAVVDIEYCYGSAASESLSLLIFQTNNNRKAIETLK